jgi:heme exporter protein A
MQFFGQNLSCMRGERLVFSGLDFTVKPGSVLVLSGNNGSGKTSLLRVMAGLTHPIAGELAWHDGSVADNPERHHNRINFVGHLNAVKAVLSVYENLKIWASLNGGTNKTISVALKKMGLEGLENTPGQYLSAGQKRRLSLARLVASHTKLWLLDEPTIALDPASVEALRDLITEHRNSGGMTIIANNVDLKIKDTTELNLHNFATISEGIWEGVG